MKINFESKDCRYSCDLGAGISLARPVRFAASETNAWGVPAPAKVPVASDGFVGSTQDGGSCNVDQLALIPHCHGTHTETIGHIVDEDYFVGEILIPSLIPAVVVSVSPVVASSVSDSYQPDFGDGDLVVTASRLQDELERWSDFAAEALIVRTGSGDAFFTNEAMATIVKSGVEHLLVDLPSVDRLDDDGLLSNHRVFWDVESGSREINSVSRVTQTITELIRVPDQVAEGPCLLSIQIPAIETDAAPSRPIVYPISRV